jgi:ATP-dependent protease ClpP protease subunit
VSEEFEVKQFVLCGYLDNDKVSDFIAELQYADEMDPNAYWDITLNSEGGDTPAGTALYETLRLYSERGEGCHFITIRAVGECCSMATLVIQAADRRETTGLTLWMFHSTLTNIEEKPARAAVRELAAIVGWDEDADAVMLERTVLSPAQFRERIAVGDWWVRADELLALGFVDEVR